MYYFGEQRDGRGAAGQGLVGAVFLLPQSLLAVSLPHKHSVAPPTPRFAYDHIASFGVYLTRCSRAKSHCAFLCRVKGHTQYVVRAEEVEPGNETRGDSVRGPVQLSTAFLPLSVLFRDSMTAVNYGWMPSASCWIESQQERTLEGWQARLARVPPRTVAAMPAMRLLRLVYAFCA